MVLEKEKGTIAVDFDGVLHTYKGWEGETVMYPPLPGTREFLEKLNQKYRVVVFTARDNLGVVADWLAEYGLLGLVNSITKEKPKAWAYIDNRAIRFNGDFGDVMNQLDTNPWWKVDRE